jgi:hypothetical protein
MDRLLVAPPVALAFQLTRAEAGMPSLVIRLSTLQPTFASIF